MPVTMTIKPRSAGRVAAVLRPLVEAHFDPRMKQALFYAQANAPVDRQGGGGRLKKSLRLYARGEGGRFASQSSTGKTLVCQYELVAEAPHAAFVIKGTRPHIIRSRGPWSLHNPKTGQFFGQIVRHPGTKPNDFITRSIQQAGIA